MTNVVSYQRVPIPRGIAFALYHCQKHGGGVDLFSGVRTVPTIREHNREFGTHLSAQQDLVDLWRAGKGNPANSPDTTSHCWRSDGNHAYRVNGKQIPSGGKLPWYMIGLDLADVGEFESVDDFLRVARHLGYRVTQPYPVGGERHHVVFTSSPINVLEHNHVIAKDRN
jgi:hypothetical protein